MEPTEVSVGGRVTQRRSSLSKWTVARGRGDIGGCAVGTGLGLLEPEAPLRRPGETPGAHGVRDGLQRRGLDSAGMRVGGAGTERRGDPAALGRGWRTGDLGVAGGGVHEAAGGHLRGLLRGGLGMSLTFRSES